MFLTTRYIGKAKQKRFWRPDISGRQNKDVFGDPQYPAQKRFVLELHYRKAAQQDCFYGARYSRAPGFSLFQVRAKAWLGSLPFPFSSNSSGRKASLAAEWIVNKERRQGTPAGVAFISRGPQLRHP